MTDIDGHNIAIYTHYRQEPLLVVIGALHTHVSSAICMYKMNDHSTVIPKFRKHGSTPPIIYWLQRPCSYFNVSVNC